MDGCKRARWFGGEPGGRAPLVLPEILRQNLGLFQCFYGAEEEYTLCRAPELADAEIIRSGGGHHFGGDYQALAEKILDGAARRLALNRLAPDGRRGAKRKWA